MSTELDELAIEYHCSYCGARPGAWCRTKSNRVATWLHGNRTYPVYQAYGQGHIEGDDDWRARLAEMTTEQVIALHQRLLEGKRW